MDQRNLSFIFGQWQNEPSNILSLPHCDCEGKGREPSPPPPPPGRGNGVGAPKRGNGVSGSKKREGTGFGAVWGRGGGQGERQKEGTGSEKWNFTLITVYVLDLNQDSFCDRHKSTFKLHKSPKQRLEKCQGCMKWVCSGREMLKRNGLRKNACNRSRSESKQHSVGMECCELGVKP